MDQVGENLHDTELGILPSDWEVVSLGDIYEIQQGKALSKKHRQGKSPSIFLRTSNVYWGKLDLSNLDEMDFTDAERQKYQLQTGDLLICEGGEIGRTAIWNEEISDCYIQNHVFRVRAKRQDVHSQFHMFWMEAAIQLLGLYRGYGNKTTIPNLSKRRLSSFPIPLPPLPEQRAIAHALNTVRRAIETTEAVITAAQELKRSMMKHLFTYGPVPVDQVDQVVLKETEIGDVPEDWDVKPLGAIEQSGGSIQTGPFGSLLHASDYVEIGIPFVMPKDLTDDAKILTDTIARIGSDDYERLSKYHLMTGDVVTARRGEIGRRALVTKEENGWVCGTGCLRLRSGYELFPGFLSHAFGTNKIRGWLLDHAVGSTMPNLSGRVLNQLPFPFPDLVIQQNIANALDKINEKISAENEKKSSILILFDSLLHHLMTGKLRIE